MTQIFASLLLLFTSSALAAAPTPVSMGRQDLPIFAEFPYRASARVNDSTTGGIRSVEVWAEYFVMGGEYANHETSNLHMAFRDENRMWNVFDLGVKVSNPSTLRTHNRCQRILGVRNEAGTESESVAILSELNAEKTALDIYLLRNLQDLETTRIADEVCDSTTPSTRIQSIVPSAKPFVSIPLK